MAFSKELKEKIKKISQTSLILEEFLAVIDDIKPVLIMESHKEKEKKLIKSNFPELFLTCNHKFIAGKQINVYAISRVKSLAEQAIECFCKKEDPYLMGKLLGYPECCIKKYYFFLNHSLQYNSPLITRQSFKKTKNFNFLTNNLFNFSTRLNAKEDFNNFRQYYFLNKKFPIPIRQLQFISHVPCSYSCEKSIKIGKEIDCLLKEYDPRVEKIVKYTLSAPILFFDIFKLVVFDGYFKDSILYYKKIIPPLFLTDGLLMKEIKKGNKIIANEKEIKIFKNNFEIFSYRKKNEMDGFILDFSEANKINKIN